MKLPKTKREALDIVLGDACSGAGCCDMTVQERDALAERSDVTAEIFAEAVLKADRLEYRYPSDIKRSLMAIFRKRFGDGVLRPLS